MVFSLSFYGKQILVQGRLLFRGQKFNLFKGNLEKYGTRRRCDEDPGRRLDRLNRKGAC